MTRHNERHFADRIGWLRAAVLGANDGIVSTASLVVGVAAAGAARGEILTAGIAGLAAGAMSMAAGEYVSVSSQADTERADLARFQAMVADVVKWRDVTLPEGGSPAGPLETVLSLHPAASVNLLAEYDRQAHKLDSTVGAVISVGIPGARITATGSVGGKNQVMATRAKEATGHFQFQERKKNVVAATQAGFGVGLSIPLLNAIAGNTGLTANGARLAESADVRTAAWKRPSA